MSGTHLNCKYPGGHLNELVIVEIRNNASAIFLALRCNVDLQMEDWQTPPISAAVKVHADVTERLIAARCNVNLAVCVYVCVCARWGHAAAGCNVGLREKGGRTALQIAQSRL